MGIFTHCHNRCCKIILQSNKHFTAVYTFPSALVFHYLQITLNSKENVEYQIVNHQKLFFVSKILRHCCKDVYLGFSMPFFSKKRYCSYFFFIDADTSSFFNVNHIFAEYSFLLGQLNVKTLIRIYWGVLFVQGSRKYWYQPY